MSTTIYQLNDLAIRERQIQGMHEALVHIRNPEDRAYLLFRIKVAKRELRKAYDRIPL